MINLSYAGFNLRALGRLADRTTLANTLHQAGRTDEAGVVFQEAEGIQKKCSRSSRCSTPCGVICTATCC